MTGYMEKQLEELKAKMERSAGAGQPRERSGCDQPGGEDECFLRPRLLHLDNDLTAAEVDRAGKRSCV